MEFIELSGIGKIKIKRGLNIKFLSIRMAPGRGVWVNVPFGVSGSLMLKFLEEKRNWILDGQKKMEAYKQDKGTEVRIGTELKTKYHLLKIVETEKLKPFYQLDDETVTLAIPKAYDLSRIEKIFQQFLLEIYRMESERYFPQKVKYYADQFGFKYCRLSFRNNVSNWGSCSHENNISLNIKLMQMPDEVIDYVILHELCHTVEKNHSADFWQLVGKVCPNYAELRVRLMSYSTRV